MAARVLVLGSTGFIGRNLCSYFRARTDYEVLAPPRRELNLLSDADCEAYLRHHRPDCVVHAAVDITSVETSLRIFFNIFNARRYIGHLIQLGSGAEYDRRCYAPLMEEQLFGGSVPIDTYGLAKYAIAREIEAAGDRRVVNLRLFGVCGRFEDYDRRFISNNICRVLGGLPVAVNRDMSLDFIHVNDLARFLVILLPKLPLAAPSYNFCSGDPVSLTALAEAIREEMGVTAPVVVRQSGRNPEYSGSPRAIFAEVGAFAFAPIREAIRDLVAFYREALTEDDLRRFREREHGTQS